MSVFVVDQAELALVDEDISDSSGSFVEESADGNAVFLEETGIDPVWVEEAGI